jgi:glycosyltransferase involved in cell wall biosynthesis
MQDYGLVSVIMPTYNCAPYIAETIRSVQSQTYKNWEIIIVDDCSTDNTYSIVETFKDKRIRYFKNSKNSGAALSRNWALREARGKWIAFLDSDDLWVPTKLEHQLKFMVENNYKFSYHEYSEIDETGYPLGVHVSGIHKVNKLNMYSCCWPGCLSVMYDCSAIGLIQINDVRKNNDTAIWLRVVCKSPCYLLKENLARYRRRKVSITPKPIWKRIWAHYPLFRIAQEMNPIAATFWTLMNVFGNGYKKLFYVTK